MKHLLAAAILLLSLAACAVPGSQQAPSATALKCADKMAQATTTTTAVPGLWNCLTPAFQTKLDANGQGKSDSSLSIGVAIRTEFLGADSDFATYELILNPAVAQQAGTKWVELTVWLDPAGSGRVDNVGVANPAF